MNVIVEKTPLEKREEVLDFIALEYLKMFLELNPKIKQLYEGDLYDVLVSTHIRDFKRTVNEDDMVYSAYIDETLVGAALIRTDGYLDSLYVKEKYRNHLVGSSLLKKIIEDCSDMKIIRVDARITAIPLYERFSFHKVNGLGNKAFIPMELERGSYGK